jgi:hypothetical protein
MTMLVGIVILVILLSGLRIAREYQRGVATPRAEAREQ